MLGISPDVWGFMGVVMGGIGAGASAIYAWGSGNARRAHELELAAITVDLNREKSDRETLERRVSAAWLKIDDLRENTVRKADLKEYRAEVKQDMKELGDRLEGAINSLRAAINEK